MSLYTSLPWPLWAYPLCALALLLLSARLALGFFHFLCGINVPWLNNMASSNAAGSSTTVLPGDSGCKTTPRRRTKSSAQPFAASPALVARDTEYREMANEMKDVTVGPMPFDDFLARYMPAHKRVPGEKWFRTKSEELRNIGYTEDQFVCSFTMIFV